jgi:hypothetical protein
MSLRICGCFKSANHKKEKDWVLKSQIRKEPHIVKVRKSTNYVCQQICGFAICKT